ncbi:hypothetical protein FOZ61_010419, partial [Perkinsus olseni]
MFIPSCQQELRGRKRPVAQMVPEKERSPSAVRAGTSNTALGNTGLSEDYSGHCMRRSAAQILFHSGVSIEHIVELGGVYQKIRQTALTNVLLQDVGVPTFAP